MKAFRFALLMISVFIFPAVSLAGGTGPAIIGGGAVAPLGTPGVMVVFDYVGTGSTVTGGSFRLALAGASAAGITVRRLSCIAPFTCPGSLAGTFDFQDPGANEVPSVSGAVSVTFDLGAANFGIVDLVVQNEQYVDAGGNPIAPNGTMNGAIFISAGPSFGILNVQPPTLMQITCVNGPPVTTPITISNDGVAGDQAITPNCTLGAVTGSPGVNITVPDFSSTLVPGTSAMVSSSCSGTVGGSAMATYACTAANAGKFNDNTVITCHTSLGIPVPNPSAGGDIALTIGPIVRGGTGSGSVAFREIGGACGGFDVSCNVSDNGGGAFAISGAATATVPAGGSATITVSGTSLGTDPRPTGQMDCTYSNGAIGTVTVALGINLMPAVIPTVTRWGLIIMTLVLLVFGAWTMHRRKTDAVKIGPRTA